MNHWMVDSYDVYIADLYSRDIEKKFYALQSLYISVSRNDTLTTEAVNALLGMHYDYSNLFWRYIF